MNNTSHAHKLGQPARQTSDQLVASNSCGAALMPPPSGIAIVDRAAQALGEAAGPVNAALVPPSSGVAIVDQAAQVLGEATASSTRDPIQMVPAARPSNRTAALLPVNTSSLPDRLKAGVEQLSGVPMDDVKVHYNSSKPAQLAALAFTQGTDIYVGPRQTEHLPHEAWHVVQQKRGSVRSTGQAGGLKINDDADLEQEAEQMGRLATQAPLHPRRQPRHDAAPRDSDIVQGYFTYNKKEIKDITDVIKALFNKEKDAEAAIEDYKQISADNTYGTDLGIWLYAELAKRDMEKQTIGGLIQNLKSGWYDKDKIDNIEEEEDKLQSQFNIGPDSNELIEYKIIQETTLEKVMAEFFAKSGVSYVPMGLMRYKPPQKPQWVMASGGFSDCVFMIITDSDGISPLVAGHVTPGKMENDPGMIKTALISAGVEEDKIKDLKAHLISRGLENHTNTTNALDLLKITWKPFDVKDMVLQSNNTSWGVAVGQFGGKLRIVLVDGSFNEKQQQDKAIYTSLAQGQSGGYLFLFDLEGELVQYVTPRMKFYQTKSKKSVFAGLEKKQEEQ